MTLGELNDAIAAIAPIIGINTEGEIWFLPEATEEQIALATEFYNENIGKVV